MRALILLCNALIVAGLLMVLASFITQAASADVTAPLTGGTIMAHWGVAPANPDAVGTQSISMQVVGTTSPIFCMDVVGGEVLGPSNVIPATTLTVVVEGISWSDLGCAGVSSLPSTEKYLVNFGAPGAPVILPIP